MTHLDGLYILRKVGCSKTILTLSAFPPCQKTCHFLIIHRPSQSPFFMTFHPLWDSPGLEITWPQWGHFLLPREPEVLFNCDKTDKCLNRALRSGSDWGEPILQVQWPHQCGQEARADQYAWIQSYNIKHFTKGKELKETQKMTILSSSWEQLTCILLSGWCTV